MVFDAQRIRLWFPVRSKAHSKRAMERNRPEGLLIVCSRDGQIATEPVFSADCCETGIFELEDEPVA